MLGITNHPETRNLKSWPQPNSGTANHRMSRWDPEALSKGESSPPLSPPLKKHVQGGYDRRYERRLEKEPGIDGVTEDQLKGQLEKHDQNEEYRGGSYGGPDATFFVRHVPQLIDSRHGEQAEGSGLDAPRRLRTARCRGRYTQDQDTQRGWKL